VSRSNASHESGGLVPKPVLPRCRRESGRCRARPRSASDAIMGLRQDPRSTARPPVRWQRRPCR
jgi:hypothetical protein